eukprot:CAMPEP_0202053980 /NCGR_PEP_ID=MMETSP0963-20130614/6180_1 /ASSEMBLY_ACC=CAM_ASM_000494 /TAXON_ID=4773 /ORGANISM="Schizochytrium aggregatum, Strain ATCC28209" /LENGTH=273 /DNA_ID=CAMNT_0048619363 /DNA_START=64 /DNA_END=885 /DNA_ORIENTATION=-
MSDQFAQQVMQIAVAQICQHEDFGNYDSAESHAFSLLTDVVGKYIEKIGKLSRRFAEHDGRTECNMLDLLQAFDKLEPNRVDWRELVRMCREVPWQVPYTSGVPEFPVERRKRRTQYGEGAAGAASSSSQVPEDWLELKRKRLGQAGVEGKDREHPLYVPNHFPPFPEKHTYSRTDVDAIEREKEATVILEHHLEEKRRVQRALANIHNLADTSTTRAFGDLDPAGTAEAPRTGPVTDAAAAAATASAPAAAGGEAASAEATGSAPSLPTAFQ